MSNYKLIRGKAFRIVKLDACGKPVEGPTSALVSDGFAKVELKAQIEAGTDYKVRNANDAFVIKSRGKPEVLWWDVNIELIGVNPHVHNLLTGTPLVMDDAITPKAVGISGRAGRPAAQFGLEVWTDLDGQPCDPSGDKAYGYFVVPFIVDAIVTDTTIENGPTTITITNARTEGPSQWGAGPFNVLKTAAGADGKLLAPIADDEHYRMIVTYLAPPVATGEPIAVPAPV